MRMTLKFLHALTMPRNTGEPVNDVYRFFFHWLSDGFLPDAVVDTFEDTSVQLSKADICFTSRSVESAASVLTL